MSSLTIWDYDQWFKILLDRLTFQFQDVQHNKWFSVGLLPHIQVSLTLKKETTLGGGETLARLAHVQSQLANLTMQLQYMVKTIVVLEHIWCTTS
jgi:hypothetical protein